VEENIQSINFKILQILYLFLESKLKRLQNGILQLLLSALTTFDLMF